MRLIDADSLIAILEARANMACATPAGSVFLAAARMVEALPAIDAASVVHAEWIQDDLCNHVCTNCNHRIPYFRCYSDFDDCDEWDEEIDLTPFCPYCGAKMDGDPNGDGA